MSIFNKATNTQAFAKVGILGFAGGGKTFTASELAVGLIKHMRSKGLEIANRPAMFLDTETGSDWVTNRFIDAEIELHTAKTRAFMDLLTAIREAESSGSILIIDSISHFWRELCDSYMKKKHRTRLQFQDWNELKSKWGEFTDLFVNSSVHIVMCGRAGFEYDYFENDDGKKELEKTGIKMKAETETGYEPSLLILMERIMDMEKKKVYRVGSILKDRSDLLDGKEFRNPKFEDFLPHVEFLNLGGAQLGVDTSRSSASMFDSNGDTKWKREREEKDICLDEIAEIIKKHHGGQNSADKQARSDLLEKVFGTPSWKRVESLDLDTLKLGRNTLWLKLEGISYSFEPPAPELGFDPDEDVPDIEEANKEAA